MYLHFLILLHGVVRNYAIGCLNVYDYIRFKVSKPVMKSESHFIEIVFHCTKYIYIYIYIYSAYLYIYFELKPLGLVMCHNGEDCQHARRGCCFLIHGNGRDHFANFGFPYN
jgi:hypothetical protein